MESKKQNASISPRRGKEEGTVKTKESTYWLLFGMFLALALVAAFFLKD
ncbi:MAG TPA: hypothetical protein PKE52_06850 [Bacteroidales bacterium]|jgi:hypothetical protein|nr:hypothetical protein [Bacteroidales bacterium]